MSRGAVTLPPWETERHKRGSIRWYPFDTALNNGLSSAGSSTALGLPGLNLDTGASTATPQNRGREGVERKQGANTADLWTGIDNLNYFGRVHHITCFVGMGLSLITPIGGRIYAGIFLMAPNGLGATFPPLAAAPNKPICMLMYSRNGILEATPDERFELITAVGDGTAPLRTRLVGVPGPISDLSASARVQRFEIFYKPGEFVIGAIDGVVGATNVTALPDPNNVPATLQNMAGVGVYLEASNVGDDARCGFHSLQIETYRP